MMDFWSYYVKRDAQPTDHDRVNYSYSKHALLPLRALIMIVLLLDILPVFVIMHGKFGKTGVRNQ